MTVQQLSVRGLELVYPRWRPMFTMNAVECAHLNQEDAYQF